MTILFDKQQVAGAGVEGHMEEEEKQAQIETTDTNDDDSDDHICCVEPIYYSI